MSKESNENLPRSTDMESSLRDRIIAALAQADQDWCSDRPLHEDMADAVIAALDRDYIIVQPGTPLAQKIVEWQWEKQDSKRPQITRPVDGSLRDRIAAAIQNVDDEHSYGTTYPNIPIEDRRLHRYVTEWTTDA